MGHSWIGTYSNLSMNKKSIILSFSKAADSYEKHAFIQRKTAEILSEKSKHLSGLGLDCGCGNCFLEDILFEKKIIGLDISKSMAKRCKNKRHRVVVGDIENIPFKDETFDYCLSNFSLHWTELDISLHHISRVLKDGGFFLFSIPVEGSLRAIEEITGKRFHHFISYESIRERVARFFELLDTQVLELSQILEDGYALLEHLHNTGTMINPERISIREKIDLVKKFKEYRKNVVLNFKVAFFSCRKV